MTEETVNREIELNPVVAVPYASGVNAIAFTRGYKWMLTGGDDGIVRKFDFHGSVEGRSLLTMTQRHALIDSIQFNGLLCSYWENEVPQYRESVNSGNTNAGTVEMQVSPVYSLAAGSEGLWALSGLENGGITLQSLRSQEGSVQWYFRNANDRDVSLEDRKYYHSGAVSCLVLADDDSSFLSGSWDRKILEWDLIKGKNKRVYGEASGQVSTLEYRPEGATPVVVEELPVEEKADVDADGDGDMDSLFSEEEDDEPEPEPVSETESAGLEQKQPPQPTTRTVESKDVFLSAAIDGGIAVWDGRVPQRAVMFIGENESRTSPWCMSACWSTSGDSVFAGRRNCCVDEYDIRNGGSALLRTLKFPHGSGPVSCVKPLDNGHLLCASTDSIRLYNLDGGSVPFSIVAGHTGGTVSAMAVDPSRRFVVSASGTRGWGGKHSDYLYVYEKQ